MRAPTAAPAAPPGVAPPSPWHATDPYRVADDTWVLGPLHRAPGAPFGVHVNSLLIRGREPVLVDTGPAAAADLWLDAAFGLVDPEDVRWVFLTHEEPDHAGNVLAVLERCPNATLVTSWFAMERLAAQHPLPLHRVRWLDDGDVLDVGDRRLRLVRPPVYDAPTTRGLLDERTGVYWAADAFGAPVVEAAQDAAELPEQAWREGVLQFAAMVSPWHQVADQHRFSASVDRIEGLRPSVVTSAHGPATSGARLDAAYVLLHRLPDFAPAPLPGQAELEAILAQAGV